MPQPIGGTGMKKSMITLGLTACMLTAQSMPAIAINKEWSAVAGFAGGVLVANAISCNRGYSRQVVYQQPVQHVVYQQPVQQVVYQPVERVVVHERPVQTGYYEWRTERRYMPGFWVYEDMGCGNRRRVWQPGYYETVRVKSWVDTTCHNGGW